MLVKKNFLDPSQPIYYSCLVLLRAARKFPQHPIQKEVFSQKLENELIKIEIEKHELNPDIPIWINVWMDRDGTVEHTNPTFNESFCPLELDKEYSQLCGEVVAQSEAHAIHIVNERRLQLIKSGEWE